VSKIIDIEEAAGMVQPGARIAFGGGGGMMRRPMEFCRELIRQNARDLNIFQFLAGIETDILIGAGAVASTNAAYLGLLEYGPAPNFSRLVSQGSFKVNEYSEFLLIAVLRAADMGIPFIPWKTPWKSDITSNLGIKTVKSPYDNSEYLAAPACDLDYAVIHTHRVDSDGYVHAPAEPDLIYDFDYLICRVAKKTIVCAEEIVPISDPAKVALVGPEVAHVVHAPLGAWPTGMHSVYDPDTEHLLEKYLKAAQTDDEAFFAYLQEYVTNNAAQGQTR